MDVRSQVQKMDAMVSQGDILNAIKQFFADDAATSDYGKVTTHGKSQMIEKMEAFLAAVAAVRGITHHLSIVDGKISASEFTFDFSMNDGSAIHWHEIIRREWNDNGKVIREEYFDAKN